jgi:hypothetical protein
MKHHYVISLVDRVTGIVVRGGAHGGGKINQYRCLFLPSLPTQWPSLKTLRYQNGIWSPKSLKSTFATNSIDVPGASS